MKAPFAWFVAPGQSLELVTTVYSFTGSCQTLAKLDYQLSISFTSGVKRMEDICINENTQKGASQESMSLLQLKKRQVKGFDVLRQGNLKSLLIECHTSPV